MKKVLFPLFLSLCMTSFAQPGNKNFIDQPYIEVSGQAEMEVTPDEIYLKILLDEKDLKSKEDLQKTERNMIRKLEEIGIDVSKDLSVKDMISNFRNYWIVGTTINTAKEYQLKVKNASTAGKVFRELASVGIANISIESVDHSEIEKFRQEVKINAIKAAKTKAGALAEAIDQEIGKAIYVQEMNFGVIMPRTARAEANIMVRGYATEDDASMPEIDFEKIKLEYTIQVRFELL